MRLIEHRRNARDHIFVRAVQNMGVNRRSGCNGTVSEGFADVIQGCTALVGQCGECMA